MYLTFNGNDVVIPPEFNLGITSRLIVSPFFNWCGLVVIICDLIFDAVPVTTLLEDSTFSSL